MAGLHLKLESPIAPRLSSHFLPWRVCIVHCLSPLICITSVNCYIWVHLQTPTARVIQVRDAAWETWSKRQSDGLLHMLKICAHWRPERWLSDYEHWLLIHRTLASIPSIHLTIYNHLYCQFQRIHDLPWALHAQNSQTYMLAKHPYT